MAARPRTLALAALLATAEATALSIVFTDVGTAPMSAQALQGFRAGATIWENVLFDPVIVRIQIAMTDFGPDNANVIGQASSTLYAGDYLELLASMRANRTSPTDEAVVAALPTGPTYSRRINLTSDTPGDDPLAPWTHTTDYFYINGANAKALGMLPANFEAIDAFIEFNTAFAFDYDRSDGIDPDKMDFIGVAAHEIGHALGFLSIADFVDQARMVDPPFSADDLAHFPMDFLRYTPESAALGLTDVTVGATTRYLLVNGVSIAMSGGVFNGDGQQASHYKDNLGLGMMDPTAAFGELRTLATADLLVMDAIGWDLVAVPEPSFYGLALGAAGLALAARRRRRFSR